MVDFILFVCFYHQRSLSHLRVSQSLTEPLRVVRASVTLCDHLNCPSTCPKLKCFSFSAIHSNKEHFP